MTTQQMLSPFRKAVTEFNMIADGDKIAVGLSGGKDSLTLLRLMKAYQRFSPQKFDLCAINIDMGFKDVTENAKQNMADFCRGLGVECHIVKTDIAEIIFEQRKEKNPCSLCSKMRRGALNTRAIELGYNKIALGHHADDLIETFLLCMFYEGRLSTFMPTSYMDRSGISLIRPLIFSYEKDIIAYSQDLPVMKNPCPSDKNTKREYMKDLIKKIQVDYPPIKERMLSAIVSSDRYNLFNQLENYILNNPTKKND